MYYHTLNGEMQTRYGRKFYKLSLDGGMTCPNRDGTLGSRGCIFCSGAGEFAESDRDGLDAQIERAKARVAAKVKGDPGYIAYFQSFTNTYAPADRLRALYEPVLRRPDISILDIATRPDCLGEEVLDLLAELNTVKPVWVELGLQTIHPETAAFIRRGYDLPCFDRAVTALKARGIEVIVHQILGLPGESVEEMWQTADYIAHSGADGVKFHLLHILRGTDLAALYEQGAVSVLTLEEYTRILMGCIARMPPSMVIHRITGDGDKKTLLAPLWSGDKKRVLNYIQKTFQNENLQQGSLFFT